MYVATFYSFKGGVGRTMALVNAAVELASRGRKVLAVDFDLEAPGLDTFEVLRPSPGVPGIINFVGEYLATGQAPDIERFVSASSAVDGLWVMPSGVQQDYAASLGQIDWQDLYDNQDGFLLFEDLKEQWRKLVQPDYVLVDSRTGHTDTCGICTRQLPQAVTLLFFPNEQNLRGLTKVVHDIRSEADSAQERQIKTHYVMSNVPDLDDEDEILQHMLKRFKDELGFDHEPHVIHRYDSLALLNQVVFTRDRPRSRLAREYRGVVDLVVRSNVEDRDGALHYIEQARRSFDESSADIGKKLTQIEQYHSEDGEVLFQLGEWASEEGEWERSKSLFNRAVNSGHDAPTCLLARARVLERTGEEGAARADARRALQASQLAPRMVRDAIRLARLDSTEDASDLPAVASMDSRAKVGLAVQLGRSGHLRECIGLLREALRRADQTGLRRRATAELALALIGTGSVGEARELLGGGAAAPQSMDVVDAFNYGMAAWGESGCIQRDVFERVVELNESKDDDDLDANYLQCMAVAYWAVGRVDAAMEYARRAKIKAASTLRPTFSCWRYRTVHPRDFLHDTNSIMMLIRGDKDVAPRFMSERPGSDT